MAAAGAARFNITRIAPYTHGNVMFQPIDWLEFGFRYTNLSNLLYGPSIAGTQDLKDKSIDIKVRLLDDGSDSVLIGLAGSQAGAALEAAGLGIPGAPRATAS